MPRLPDEQTPMPADAAVVAAVIPAATAAVNGAERFLEVLAHVSYSLLPLVGSHGQAPLMATSRVMCHEVAAWAAKVKWDERTHAVDAARAPAWAARCRNARSLNIVAEESECASPADVVSVVVAASSLPQLEALHLHSCSIDNAALVALAAHFSQMKSLKQLDLSSNQFGAVGTQYLTAFLPKLAQLAALELSDNNLCGSSAALLAHALPCLPLLSFIDLGYNPLGDDGVAALAGALPRLPRLSKLHLSSVGCGNVGAEALAAVAPSLLQLAELDVSHNNVGGANVAALLVRLRSAPLAKLNVAGSVFSADRDMAPFVQALACVPLLEELKMQGCFLGDEGAAAIASPLVRRLLPRLTLLAL